MNSFMSRFLLLECTKNEELDAQRIAVIRGGVLGSWPHGQLAAVNQNLLRVTEKELRTLSGARCIVERHAAIIRNALIHRNPEVNIRTRSQSVTLRGACRADVWPFRKTRFGF
jgi:hypothetical protein